MCPICHSWHLGYNHHMSTQLKADLHCHSLFSDGALSPEALIAKAIEARVELLALTDHDTISGVTLLCEAARDLDIRIIQGVELSVRWKMHDIHLLGLNINIHHPALVALLSKQSEQRVIRAKEMAKLLEVLGIGKIYQKACELAGHERIGRPHIAQVLVNEGVVSNITSAFKRYLVRGRLGYVPTNWISLEEAVSVILDSGGNAVIAHPLKYKLTRSKLHLLINEFKCAGGDGIEVVSGEMNVSQMQELSGICLRYDLFASTGSDFHNEHDSRIKLGQQHHLPVNCKPIWEKWN